MIDPVTQVTPIHVAMTITGTDGSTVSRTSDERDRFWTRDELDAAGRLAGLKLESQHGDFDGKPLSADGAWRMILVFRVGT